VIFYFAANPTDHQVPFSWIGDGNQDSFQELNWYQYFGIPIWFILNWLKYSSCLVPSVLELMFCLSSLFALVLQLMQIFFT